MDNEIEKSERANPDDVLTAIMSFNDPSIIINIFEELGWTYSFEIKEWLGLARQDANLSVKAKALIQLRKLLREAAEASGYVARVSSTIPNPQGGQTTFSAKRIAGSLNPVKKIESSEIKETQNDKRLQSIESPSGCDEEKSDRGSDRGQSQTEESVEETRGDNISPGTDTRRAFPIGDADSGGTEPPDGGKTGGIRNGETDNGRGMAEKSTPIDDSVSEESNPCVKTRPPNCNRDLFPGISSAED